MEQYLRIGQVAEIAAIDIDVLRTMVRREQVIPTVQNGWAKFDHVDAFRVYILARLSDSGFPLTNAAKIAFGASIGLMISNTFDPSLIKGKLLLRRAAIDVKDGGTITEWETDVIDGDVITTKLNTDVGMSGARPMVSLVIDLELMFNDFCQRLVAALSISDDTED